MNSKLYYQASLTIVFAATGSVIASFALHEPTRASTPSTQASMYVTVVRGQAWIRRNHQHDTVLKCGVKLPMKVDDILHCERKSVVNVDLGNGMFQVMQPCEFRIPSISRFQPLISTEIAAVMSSGARKRTGNTPALTSPKHGERLNPVSVIARWAPTDTTIFGTITLRSVRTGDLLELDYVDLRNGTINSDLLKRVLLREKQRGDLGPFTLKLDCGTLGTDEAMFILGWVDSTACLR